MLKDQLKGFWTANKYLFIDNVAYLCYKHRVTEEPFWT